MTRPKCCQNSKPWYRKRLRVGIDDAQLVALDMVRNRGASSAGATQQLRPFAGISWGRVFQLMLPYQICERVRWLMGGLIRPGCIQHALGTPRRKRCSISPLLHAKYIYSRQRERFHIRPPVQIEINQFVKPSPQCHAGAKTRYPQPSLVTKQPHPHPTSTYLRCCIPVLSQN